MFQKSLLFFSLSLALWFGASQLTAQADELQICENGCLTLYFGNADICWQNSHDHFELDWCMYPLELELEECISDCYDLYR
ncbi:MAG: hypothetical protein QNK37_21980 [Acidobacteriota bacterium]|nr:hypothetical protein [Acidobacteriota bacterium]